MTSSAQQTALRYVETIQPDLSDWTKTIFDFGETAWREYQSCAWYVERRKASPSRKAPTAFSAHWSNGPGPTVGLYAEYDAVPGNCQDAATIKRARPGLSELAGGHTDPHSGLGMAALGGLLAKQGRDAETRHWWHAALHRRAGRKGARLQADPCRARLL